MSDAIVESKGEENARVEELRRRIATLQSDLEARPQGTGERERLRDELVGIVRDLDGMIDELSRLRTSVQPLASLYKEIFPRRPPVAGDRIDHLGASTYRERGWSALAAGEDEDAVRQLRRAVDLDPEETTASVMLAWGHLKLGRPDEAARLLGDSLERDPGHPLGRVVWAYGRIATGDFEEAIETLTSVASTPGDRTAALYAHLYLGLAYAGRGMYRDAQSYLRKAIELGPNLTEAYWELGRAHQAEGRTDLALEAWRAGGENRFNAWGERCRLEVDRVESGRDGGG